MTTPEAALPPAQTAVTTTTGASGELSIERGTCFVHFAYDVGLAIDLDEAQRRITATKQRAPLPHKRRAPEYFQYQPPPVRVALSTAAVQIGAFASETVVEAVLYDFGAVSVQYSIPLRCPLNDLLELSNGLYDNPDLLVAARGVVESLLHSIASAVTKGRIVDFVDDYAVYRIEELSPAEEPDALIGRHAQLLAQILRAERATLSRQEIDDALACQMSFAPAERTLIDWNAALLFGRDLDDVHAVLEFANVELLEMRFLDDRLDKVLDQAYEASIRPIGRLVPFFRTGAEELSRIAALQTDSAKLYEGVNNALKLLGDQYLARVHRLVSQRFHLTEWDQSILRKLQTIESIYGKIADRNANRRMEVLEWIIILLITLELAVPFVRTLAR